jgi:hypothetical protein
MSVEKLGRRARNLFARGTVQMSLIKSARFSSSKCDGRVRTHFNSGLLCPFFFNSCL